MIIFPALLAIERDLEAQLKEVERKFHSLTECLSGYRNNFTTTSDLVGSLARI